MAKYYGPLQRIARRVSKKLDLHYVALLPVVREVFQEMLVELAQTGDYRIIGSGQLKLKVYKPREYLTDAGVVQRTQPRFALSIKPAKKWMGIFIENYTTLKAKQDAVDAEKRAKNAEKLVGYRNKWIERHKVWDAIHEALGPQEEVFEAPTLVLVDMVL